jgi:hypothetical protein
LCSGQAAPVDAPELAEAVACAIGTFGLPFPQSPSSAGFVYRDDCRSSMTFARHVMFQDDIADAINGVRYAAVSAIVGMQLVILAANLCVVTTERVFQIFVPNRLQRARVER